MTTTSGCGDAAAVALETLGAHAPGFLVAFLQDEKDEARGELLEAINTIIRLGAKVTPKDLIRTMQINPRYGLYSVALLSARRTPGSARRDDPILTSFLAYYANPEHVKAAGLDDPRIPETAAACAAFFGMSALPVSPTREASPEMFALLESDDPATAALGATLVGGMGSAHPDSQSALRALANRKAFGGARMAALVIELLTGESPSADTDGEEPAASVPALESALAEITRITATSAERHWNSDVMRAVKELRVLAPELGAAQMTQVAESMVALLNEEELGWIHAEAVAVLGALGSAAAPAVPALMQALTAADADVARPSRGRERRPGHGLRGQHPGVPPGLRDPTRRRRSPGRDRPGGRRGRDPLGGPGFRRRRVDPVSRGACASEDVKPRSARRLRPCLSTPSSSS